MRALLLGQKGQLYAPVVLIMCFRAIVLSFLVVCSPPKPKLLYFVTPAHYESGTMTNY